MKEFKGKELLKVGKTVSIFVEDLLYEVYIQACNKETINGVIIFSNSAYGSAATHNELEEGQLINLAIDDITAVYPSRMQYTAEEIKSMIDNRKRLLSQFITADNKEYVMQSVEFDITPQDSIFITYNTGYTPKDKNEWALYKAYYNIASGNNTSAQASLYNAIISSRFHRVSSSGDIVDNTIIKVCGIATTFGSIDNEFYENCNQKEIPCLDVIKMLVESLAKHPNEQSFKKAC